MDTSRYFERTLFYDLSPTAEEHYARSAESIFEKDLDRSHIEVWIQSSTDASCHDEMKDADKTPEKLIISQTNTENVVSICTQPAALASEASKSEKHPRVKQARLTPNTGSCYRYDSESDSAQSLYSQASSTALSTALDHHRGCNPPSYPGPAKLTKVDLDIKNVQAFVKRTTHNFRVFYIGQRHSFSRLQITQDLFEQLLRSCHAFPRFNEYVIGLGLKSSDSEVTPPPLHYRPLKDLRENSYHGFGECRIVGLHQIVFANAGQNAPICCATSSTPIAQGAGTRILSAGLPYITDTSPDLSRDAQHGLLSDLRKELKNDWMNSPGVSMISCLRTHSNFMSFFSILP